MNPLELLLDVIFGPDAAAPGPEPVEEPAPVVEKKPVDRCACGAEVRVNYEGHRLCIECAIREVGK